MTKHTLKKSLSMTMSLFALHYHKIILKLLTLLICIITVCPIWGVDSVSPSWPLLHDNALEKLAVDESGSRYVVSSASTSTVKDFNPFIGLIDYKTGFGNSDILITKFHRDGTYAWTQIIGGSDLDNADTIIAANGKVYIGGYTSSNNFGIGLPGIIKSSGTYSGFVVVLDAQTGIAVTNFGTAGIQLFTSSGSDYVRSLSLEGDTLFVAGEYGYSDFTVGTNITPGPGSYVNDAFVVAIDAKTGLPKNSFGTNSIVTIAGTSSDSSYDSLVSAGIIYICGRTNSTGLSINGDPVVNGGSGNYDAFIVALDASTGTAVQTFGNNGINRIGGSSSDYGTALAVNDSTVYVTGYFSGTNLGVNGTGSITSSGSYDVFIAAFDKLLGTSQMGFGNNGIITFGGYANDMPQAMVISNSKLYVCGHFYSANLALNGVGPYSAIGVYDGYVVALDPNSGNSINTFGDNGLVQISGSNSDIIYDLQIDENSLLLAGRSLSTDGHITGDNSTGWSATSAWPGLFLSLNKETGQQLRPLLFESIPVKNVTDPPFALNITPAPGGGNVLVKSSDPNIASINGTTVTIHAVGTIYLTAIQDGTPNGIVMRELNIIQDEAPNNYPPLLRGDSTHLAIDADGNRYITGNFSGAFDFNPYPNAYDPKISSGEKDIYITRINADGSYGWTQIIGGSLDETPFGIEVVGDTIYIGGYFESLNLGYNGTGSLSSFGLSDCFVAAINRHTGILVPSFNGGFQQIGGDSDEEGRALACSNSVIYITGDTISQNMGIGGLGTHGTTSSTRDVFIAAISMSDGSSVTNFSTDGIQGIGGSSNDFAYGITVKDNDLVVVGAYQSASLKIAGVGGLTRRQSQDAFIAVLSSITGEANTQFSTDGLEHISGSSFVSLSYEGNMAKDVIIKNNVVYVTGRVYGTGVGIGNYYSQDTYSIADSFIAALTLNDGLAVPNFGINGLLLLKDYREGIATKIIYDENSLYILGNTYAHEVNPFKYPYSGSNIKGYIAKLDVSTGAFITQFSEDGVQTFTGGGSLPSNDIAIYGDQLYILGNSLSDGHLGINEWSWSKTLLWNTVLLSISSLSGAPELLINQSLSMDPIPGKAYNAPPFDLSITPNNSGNPVIITSSNPGIASINGITVTIHKTGTVFITATQAAGNGYPLETVTQELTIITDSYSNAYPPIIYGNIKGICTDDMGNTFITGTFLRSRDFNPIKGGIDIKENQGSSDVYVTKINADNSYAWTKVIGGINNDTSSGITYSNGTIYVAGTFYSPLLRIEQTGTGIAANGSTDGFIAALDAANGTTKVNFGIDGLVRVGGDSTDSIASITVSDYVYVAGRFMSANLGIGSTGTLASLGSPHSGFVAALSPVNGSAINTFGGNGLIRFGSDDYSDATALKCINNTLFVSGRFNSTNFGIGNLGTISSNSAQDGFIIALNKLSGVALNAFANNGIQQISANNSVQITALTSNNSTLLISGDFYGLQLGIGGLGTIDGSPNLSNAFIAAIDLTTGNAINTFGQNGITHIGGNGAIYCNDIFVLNNLVYGVGSFSALNCGIGLNKTLSNKGDLDGYVVCLSADNGQPNINFSDDGFLQFAGTNTDVVEFVTANNNKLIISGRSTSYDTQLDGSNSAYNFASWNGYILSIDPITGLRESHLQMEPLGAVSLLQGTVNVNVIPGPSGAPVVITSSSNSIASVSGNVINLLRSGIVKITATQAAGNGYEASSITQELYIVEDYYSENSLPMLKTNVTTMTIDGEGNRYIASLISSYIYPYEDFNPEQGSVDIIKADYDDMIITRFNKDGSYAWSQKLDSEYSSKITDLLIIDQDIYATGYFDSGIIGINGVSIKKSFGYSDGFIAKLSKNSGSPILDFGEKGIVQIGGSGVDRLNSLSTHNNTLFAGGEFNSSDLGVNQLGSVYSSVGSYDGIVLALDTTDGSLINSFGTNGVLRIGGNYTDTITSLAVNADSLFILGYLGTNEDSYLSAVSLTNGSSITTFGTNGTTLISSTGDVNAKDLIIRDNHIFIIGDFSGSNLRINSSGNINSEGNYDVFVGSIFTDTGLADTTFGTGGLQKISGSSSEVAGKITASIADSTLIIGGMFSSNNLGIGGLGNLVAGVSYYNQIFICQLDITTGLPKTSFSGDGLERFVSNSAAEISGLEFIDGSIIAAGTNSGSSFGWVHAKYLAEDYDGFLYSIPLNGILSSAITIYDTTVVVDGYEHFAQIKSQPGGLPLTVTYNGSVNPPSAVGTYTVHATSTDPFFPGEGYGTLNIVKAKLIVTPDDKWRRSGEADPPFTYTITGFIDGDNESLLTTLPTFTTTANSTSGAGRYPITGSGTIAPGYAVEHRAALLTIYGFDATGVVLRGTAQHTATGTVSINSNIIPIAGIDWAANGDLGGDGPFQFVIEAQGTTTTDKKQQTITIEAIDVPLLGN